MSICCKLVQMPKLNGFIAGPFSIQVGDNVQEIGLYVASLKDPMLLGLDFLRGHKAKLNFEHGTLSSVGEKIQMTFSRTEPPDEARVSLARYLCVPAISLLLCLSHFIRESADCIVYLAL